MQQGADDVKLWKRPTRKEIKRLETLVAEWQQRCADQSRTIARLKQQLLDREAAKDWALCVDALRAASKTTLDAGE